MNGSGCERVRVQGMHQRRAFQNDANPRVAMAVDPPLVTLGQAKPPLQIEIVLDLLKLALAHEQAGEKADHHLGHLLVNRVPGLLESIDQLLELLLPLRAAPRSRFEGRGDFLDVLDVAADRLLFGLALRRGRGRCSRPVGRVAALRTPFFLVQVPLDRLADLIQGLGHPQAGRVERSSLIVVEDATHRRAIVEHHGAGRIGRRQPAGPPAPRDRDRGLVIVFGRVLRRLDIAAA